MTTLLALITVVLVISAFAQRSELNRLKRKVADLASKLDATLAQSPRSEAFGARPASDATGVEPKAPAQAPAEKSAVNAPADEAELSPLLTDILAAHQAARERPPKKPTVTKPVSAPPPDLRSTVQPPKPARVESNRVEAPRAAPPSDVPPPPASSPPSKPPPPPRPKFNWEQQIGARLPVWVGGIAVALAGVFLVKYSIDTGLLNPGVRCVLAAILGFACLGAAQWVVWRRTVANGVRIAQALSGAGIATLYGTLFAAGSVYGFISAADAFAGMAAVTALAVFLSLRHGQPIAVLGMVGGFLTPALVSSDEPNAAVLFTYLSALTIGLFVVVRREKWWWLAWPTIVAAYAWVIVWLIGGGAPQDGLWVGLFLIVISAVAFSFVGEGMGGAHEPQLLKKLTWPGLMLVAVASVSLMCVVLVRSAFGATEWGLYGVLAAGAIALAISDQERYRFLPWMTMAASAVLLVVWDTAETEFFALVLTSFAALFVVSDAIMMWRAAKPIEWGGLSCSGALLFYLIGLGRLHDVTTVAFAGWPVWGLIAALLATAATLMTARVAVRMPTAEATTQRLLALFSLTATAFLSIGLAVEIDRPYLPVAIAMQTLAVAWINSRVDVRILRWIAAGLGALFLWLIFPQLVGAGIYAIRMTFGLPLDQFAAVPLAMRPLFQLGVPTVAFALSSWYLRRQADDDLVRVFETVSAALLGLMGYYLIRLAHVPAAEVLSSPGTSFEGAVITHSLLLYAIALLAGGRYFKRPAIIAAAFGAAVIGIGRVVQFDIQPVQLMGVWLLMTVGDVSTAITSLPIALSPVFYLGIPAALLVAFRLVLGHERDDWLVRLIEYVAIVLAGLMGYFLIRHAFHPAAEALTALGSRFEGGIISQAQIVYAIALVAAGRYFTRVSLINGGLIAAGMAVARIALFDGNPFVVMTVAAKFIYGMELDPHLTLPIASAPLFHLGVPAVLLAGFVYALGPKANAFFAAFFEYVAIIFTGFMGYYLIRHAFNPADAVFSSPGTFLERGVLTNAILMFGVALYMSGQRLQRQTWIAAGVVAAVFAMARIGLLDVLISSPLVAPHDVGALPVLNALLLPYGLPVLWLTLFARALSQRGHNASLPFVNGTALLFFFMWVSLNVRQAFQGPILNASFASNSEIYAYSVAWLALGVSLLVSGTWRKDRVMRIASLPVMVLTIAKVFIYDAWGLEDLWRVASFLGLGLSLMGLGWFYMRYVFAGEEPKPAA